MTYDDDHLHLVTPDGVRRFPCKANGIDWPPPEEFRFGSVLYARKSYSSITDEQRADMTHVCRGALYEPRLDS